MVANALGIKHRPRDVLLEEFISFLFLCMLCFDVAVSSPPRPMFMSMTPCPCPFVVVG